MNNQKVSVVMITYGHEKYIAEAIYGVLMQECDFELELIISNDCSPDKTDDIIQDILQTHPNSSWIKYIKQEKNIGMMPNFELALQKAQGKYIALCEGDDYWSDSNKLRKQVDFMKKNRDYSMVFHSVNIKNEVPDVNFEYPIPSRKILSFNDILSQHYIPTCSILFRSSHLPSTLPSFFSKCMMGDIPLELMLADRGKVFFMNEKMATYRFNNGGITRSKSQIKKGREGYVFMYKNLIDYFFPNHFFSLGFKLLKTKVGSLKTFFKSL